MLSIFLSALPTSLALLWTSYGPPSSNGYTGVGIENLVEYSSILPLSLDENGMKIRINMDGSCWAGTRKVGCEEGLVGKMVSNTIPFLLSYQIYYSLVTYTLLLGIFYHYTTTKRWMNNSELKVLRRFTLVVLVIKDFIGVFGVIFSSLSLLLLPLIDPSVDHIIDVKLGWASIISIFAVFGSTLLTAGYDNWSKDLWTNQAENGIFLSDEIIDDIEHSSVEIEKGQNERPLSSGNEERNGNGVGAIRDDQADGSIQRLFDHI
ncbi:hypothetical protein I203_104689 [Kwoniella mangroviensis CBS 8507]|uniref:uncharacterized protein n=1 Tax=Kwoniella mangroviensis CBS 8507 TaxID=1296122 RepID=UPI00080CECFC|nr:uncharacterized protein I203_00365 [Kwoniella mangroviensis CBS 8507]OCF70233.1 hypothetical protein I203_00365 [Kwoniella mangroviensis CBS 8507]